MASYRKPRNVRLTTCLAPTLFVSMCLLSYWYGSIVPASISMVLRLPLAYAAYVRHQQTFYLTTKWVLRVTHNDSVPVPTKWNDVCGWLISEYIYIDIYIYIYVAIYVLLSKFMFLSTHFPSQHHISLCTWCKNNDGATNVVQGHLHICMHMFIFAYLYLYIYIYIYILSIANITGPMNPSRMMPPTPFGS